MSELRQITVDNLMNFVESAEYGRWKVVPITKHRALSHSKNPRALPGDVALIVATEGDEMVGYIGMLPDHFFSEAGMQRGAWLSTLWVDPAMRGRGIGKRLLDSAFQCWNDRIAITRYTSEARQLYHRSGKFVEQEWIGVRCYLRFNLHDLLPARYPKLRVIRWLLRGIDATLNALHDPRLRRWLARNRPSGRCEYTNTVDDDLATLIPDTSNLLRRDKQELNWILSYPWVTDGSPDHKYHFTSSEPGFEIKVVKVYDAKGLLMGWGMLNIRHGKVQVPYCFATSDDGYKLIMSTIIQEMVKNRMNVITVIKPKLSAATRAHGPFWLRRKFVRQYFFSKDLRQHLGESGITFQDGDGDAAWT